MTPYVKTCRLAVSVLAEEERMFADLAREQKCSVSDVVRAAALAAIHHGADWRAHLRGSIGAPRPSARRRSEVL